MPERPHLGLWAELSPRNFHHPLAALIALWHGATRHALPTSPATTRHRSPLTAGAVFVSCLHSHRLHAGERHAVPAPDLSRGHAGIHACAPHAPRHGRPRSFRELPIWQRSRRGTHFPVPRVSASGSHRISTIGCTRTSSTGRATAAGPSASRASFSRLN